MYSEQIKRYSKVNELFSSFGSTTVNIQFDETQDAVEIYFLMTLKFCQNHSKAIVLLLENNLPLEVNPLIRNFMESFFKLNWIVIEKDRKIRLERVYKLEAHSFKEYEKEMEYIGNSLHKNYTFFPKEEWQKRMEFIENEKNSQPQLTTLCKNGKRIYKSAPVFADMMGEKFRVKYYHFYKFISAYVHPTPFMKIFLLNSNKFEKKPNEIIIDPINQSLAFGLMFLQLILGYSIDIFMNINPELHIERIRIYQELETLARGGYEGYISTPI